jgi:iron-sulfur cluster repair protein YtfE (RIC family)
MLNVSEAETLAVALEREHREIDGGIEAFLDGSADGAEALSRATRALRRHIYLEEAFLFPPLREAGMVAPIFVMLREHGELWRTMEEIEREEAGSDALRGLCRQLLAQLEKHNSKEEPILYPHADSVLTASAGAELRAFLQTGGMPGGWVCSGATA